MLAFPDCKTICACPKYLDVLEDLIKWMIRRPHLFQLAFFLLQAVLLRLLPGKWHVTKLPAAEGAI